MIRGTAPNETADVVILLGDENGISVPLCHLALLDWHRIAQPSEIILCSGAPADGRIFVATPPVRDLVPLLGQWMEKNVSSTFVDTMMPPSAGIGKPLAYVVAHLSRSGGFVAIDIGSKCRCQATPAEICPRKRRSGSPCRWSLGVRQPRQTVVNGSHPSMTSGRYGGATREA
jgi:hypothetical protein